MTSTWFDLTIMACILFNIITMGMTYDGQSIAFTAILTNINLFFTGVFIIEAIAKIFAMSCQYFYSSWNVFDFVIVILSMFDIMMAIVGAKLFSFLRSGPQIARVLRVLRVSRLFKL